jgi:hypothetical protein
MRSKRPRSEPARVDPPPPQARVVVYLSVELHRALKSELALEGLSVSEFIRRAALERTRRRRA